MERAAAAAREEGKGRARVRLGIEIGGEGEEVGETWRAPVHRSSPAPWLPLFRTEEGERQRGGLPRWGCRWAFGPASPSVVFPFFSFYYFFCRKEERRKERFVGHEKL